MQTQDILVPRYAYARFRAQVQQELYQTEGERTLAAWMAEQMRGLGLEVELTPVEADRVNAIGRLRGSGGGKSLMFNGHIDTTGHRGLDGRSVGGRSTTSSSTASAFPT